MKKLFLATLLSALVVSLSSCGALSRAITTMAEMADTEGAYALVGTVWVAKLGGTTYTITIRTSDRLDWETSGSIDAITKKPNVTLSSKNYTYTDQKIVITDPKGETNPMNGVVNGNEMDFSGFVFTKKQ
jgi:hypothetical protein